MTLATPLERLGGRPAEAVDEHPFAPGSIGWTVDDLMDDPALARRYSEGRWELVEGALAELPPVGIQGISPINRLRRDIERQLDATGQGGEFYPESDLLLRPRRVPRPDMLFLTDEQWARQKQIEAEKQLDPNQYRPVYVVPLLIIESISKGYEDHDRITKRRWYRLAGVPHYWLLDPGDQSLECLTLDGGRYRRAALGRGEETIRAPIFGGVEIPLAKVWG